MPYSQTYPNRKISTIEDQPLPNGVAALAIALCVLPMVLLVIQAF